MIIGNDTLGHFDNVRINYRKNTVEIPKLGIFKIINSSKVTIEENTIIVPHTEQLIQINTDIKEKTAFFVNKEKWKQSNHLLTIHQIANVHENTYSIYIQNIGRNPLKLKKETILEHINGIIQESKHRLVIKGEELISEEIQLDNIPEFPRQQKTLSYDKLITLVKIDTTNVSKQNIQKIRNLIWKYRHIFHNYDGKPGRYNGLDTIKIKLKNINYEPKRIRAGRLPKEKEKAMEEQLEILLNNDMIEQSRSPYLSRALLVKKKNGEYRFVVDFRELNLQLMKQSNYIPRVEDIMQEAVGNKFHTVMDFKLGFHQIPLDTNSKRLASFVTHKGIYSYKVMPMGLSGSPDTFQRIVENMMNQVEGSFVYIDDILLTAKNENEHIRQIEKTFRIMEKYNTKITLEKTEFGKAEIKYLGFMLSKNGIRLDPKKVQAIKDKEAPKNDKEVKAFIRMCSYFRRHIQNLAKIADPLHKIVNNYKWTEIEDIAFVNLKKALINETTLKPPNPDKNYTIQTDASFQGLGAVLLQDDNPIAFASRGLKAAEKNYEIMRLEGIAILFALKTFRPYIYGLKENIIQPEEFEKYYTNTERKLLHSSNTVKTQHGERYLVPETIKEQLLKQYHEHPWLGGNYGYEKNIQKFRQIYYWKTLEEDAKKIWKECIECMKNKPQPYFQLKNSLGKIPTADYACYSYSVDIMTVTDDLHYLIVIDDF
uniref:RNA-directed DNA polymerase n=1 Tax=Strongyloides venezuelensis TaxID=75913 RepID=A0A0K0G3A2_STRVS